MEGQLSNESDNYLHARMSALKLVRTGDLFSIQKPNDLCNFSQRKEEFAFKSGTVSKPTNIVRSHHLIPTVMNDKNFDGQNIINESSKS